MPTGTVHRDRNQFAPDPVLYREATERTLRDQDKARARITKSCTRPSIPLDNFCRADDKRKVLARDGERCSFVSEGGHRCESTAFLEFDHIVPMAKGGQTTADNLRLLCREHNQYMARKELGPLFARELRAGYGDGSGASCAAA